MICGYDSQNILHRRALLGKEAASIVVSKQHRRVDIQFSSNIHNWDYYDINTIRVHMPVEDIDIQGLSNELGVYTVDGIYLSHKNVFTRYLRELLKKFDCDHSSKDRQLFYVLLSIACNERLLDIKPTDQSQHSNDSLFRNLTQRITPYDDLLWERIDRDEFISKLFEESYVLYRPRDWSRQTKISNVPEYLDQIPQYVEFD